MDIHLIYNTIIFGIIFLILFTTGEIIHYLFKVNAEHTRKYIHISTGIITLFFPIYIINQWLVYLLCFSFLIILILSKRFDLLKSINNVKRTTHGSILYPISVSISYFVFSQFQKLEFFYLPILILAISDPLAANIGRKWENKNPKCIKFSVFNNHKTFAGSLAFLLSSAIISSIVLYAFNINVDLIFFTIIASTSITSTFAEAVSNKGFDNLFIPLSVLSTLLINFCLH